MARRREEAKVCGVLGCNNLAKRSIPTRKIREAIQDLRTKEERRRTYLCKEHYKKFKKETKEERKLERLGW